MKRKSEVVRAIVVDDSPTARDLLVSLLQTSSEIQVVGTGSNGEDALRLTKRMRPDVLVIDIHMPRMNGLQATRQIMQEVPTPIVLVTGTLMRTDVDPSFEALRAGALTVVAKPGLADTAACEALVQKVRAMAGVPVVRRWGERSATPLRAAVATRPRCDPPTLIPEIPANLRLIGIASSTGGPGALAAILGRLPAAFPLPILIVQHVTTGFAAGLAEWLDAQTPLQVRLADHGAEPQRGRVLVAPDEYHMQLNRKGVIELYKGPPYKGLRPSANYLFESLAQVHASRALGIILTGMGDDGVEGLIRLHEAGGLTLGQDEATCVVYGMPREAMLRNALDAVLSLEQIAQSVEEIGVHYRDRT
ncbi:MAG: chemotaxis-specific protein-glutamate methyltransferase CheB [Anaerolineales bacterium]